MPRRVDYPPPEPLHVDVLRVIEIGMAIWTVALALLVLVPALHTGDRHWWPWVAVCGLVLGAMGWAYVRRGRGNASTA